MFTNKNHVYLKEFKVLVLCLTGKETEKCASSFMTSQKVLCNREKKTFSFKSMVLIKALD